MIVTGGNGGIGLGMARGLAEGGADIAIVGRNDARSNAAVAALAGLQTCALRVQMNEPGSTRTRLRF